MIPMCIFARDPFRFESKSWLGGQITEARNSPTFPTLIQEKNCLQSIHMLYVDCREERLPGEYYLLSELSLLECQS